MIIITIMVYLSIVYSKDQNLTKITQPVKITLWLQEIHELTSHYIDSCFKYIRTK